MRCTGILIFFLIAHCTAEPRSSSASDPQCPAPRLKNGRVRSKGRGGRIVRYSCSADYELVGNKYSTCVRGSWDTETPICVSTKCAAPATPPHAMVGDRYKGAVLMYFCEPGYKLVGNTQIYCDGRQWNGTAPYCRDTKTVAPTSCDFEKDGLCWWEQDPKHDFDWIRHRFETPSSHIGTGPTYDHTFGAGLDGYYMYIESSGRLINDTARLLSPLYAANLTDTGCFSFWYHMYGATIGSLNVYFKPETEKSPRLMWSMHGNQGKLWQRGIFDLPPVNSSFQLIIEGVRGPSYVSDIAIDDLALLQGDQCAVKNATVTDIPPDGDEVEIFNAMQTCRNRCVNSLTETTPSSELYSNPEVCTCTINCADTGSCCPDFAEYCVFEATDLETIIPSQLTTSQPTENQSSTSIRSSSSESTIQTTESTTTTSTAAAAAAATTSTPKKIPIVTERETTAQKETKAESPEPMSSSTMTAINEETPFFAPVRETPADAKSLADNHVVIQDAPSQEKKSPSLSGVGGIVSILMGLVITGMVGLVLYRRRNLYKRSSSGSAYSDDSVQFLNVTSDDAAGDPPLDFRVAKPADY